MNLFLDSADINEIEYFKEFIDGVTTNPSSISKSWHDTKYEDLIHAICTIIKGPVSVEVIANTHDDMLKEALHLTSIAKNVVIKLPLTHEGLVTCKKLWQGYQIPVNMTLCFSLSQAILAAKAGATFISPFIGRLDDISCDGMNFIQDICRIYSNYRFNTQVLVSSVRSVLHFTTVAKIGAHAITLPVQILKQILKIHPLTEHGITIFQLDWETRR
ncbi:transaldolase family protein [Wolbachia endosymbiont of Howardula sp.]|uniref:transaldolase family protein n=1 Tax=Wolbachia endosymbiont of Howardula sp. TaxID=2916816 RepID=UPI00217EF2BB|nr:transaldolase family protein [Wolbachia endosymbiont of Howardula sp.]UWI83172.1 fructose-6-phosphate aldolase [Wolbachia endosymbiont of Howardula sp.]